MTRPATQAQELVLSAIDTQSRLRGYSPTVREVCDALGFRSTNAVATHVERLRVKGLLEHEPRPVRARSFELTPAGRAALEARRWKFLPVDGGVVGDAVEVAK